MALRVEWRTTGMYSLASQISYIWKDASKNFWVMGTNRQVFAPGFPIDMMRAGIAGVLGLLLVLAIVGGIGAVVYFVFMS